MKIVCFGDSLTVGYQSPTTAHPYYHETPYGQMLQRWFGEKAEVLVCGVNGELTSEMIVRFPRAVIPHTPDYVVILGGTNDLGFNIGKEDILRNLVQLCELARKASILPIVVTIPSLRSPGGDGETEFIWPQIERRIELNQAIKVYCRTSEISCIDLFSQTMEEGSGQLAAEYSNDGLHLSTAGYRRVAELLWDHVWEQKYGERFDL